MGGTSGHVKGKSKVETYLKYVNLTETQGDTFLDGNPNPALKKYCKREMVQDVETGEWVLHYHLHT